MPKLSASVGLFDTEEIPRTELTPELIRNMSDEEIDAYLLKLRGNREVTMGKSKGERSSNPKSPKTPKDKNSAADDIFE